MVAPRDDGFRSGLSVLSTYTSESPAAGVYMRAGDDLSWRSDVGGGERKLEGYCISAARESLFLNRKRT